MDGLSRTRQVCIRRDNDVRTAAEQVKQPQEIFKEGVAACLDLDIVELDLLLTPPEQIIAVVDEDDEAQSSRESMEEE